MKDHKFDVLVNPLGQIFNPHSLCRLFEFALQGKELPETLYIRNAEIWHHFDVHSDLSSMSLGKLKSKIALRLEQLQSHLKSSSLVFATLGTAFVYEYTQMGHLVANCHKIPQNQFAKRLMQVEEIVDRFDKLMPFFNPVSQNIVLTVSPVRHIKDGMEMNGLSKATLVLAAHRLAAKYPNIHYFPAYELLMDDLRDYRFYDPDMLHPSVQAIDYIWEKFGAAYFSDQAKIFVKKWEKVLFSLNHRPFHPESEAHQAFLKKLMAQLKNYQEVDTSQEQESVAKWILPE